MPQKERFSSQRVLATYVDDMITAKMGNNIDQKQRAQLRQDLMRQLEEAFQRGMVEALPDAKLMELDKLLDEDADESAVDQLLANAGVDYNKVMLEVLKKFRAEYLGVAQQPVQAQPTAQSVQAQVAQSVQEQSAQPVQGTVSEIQGQSNIEGVAVGAAAVAPQPVQAQPMTQSMQQPIAQQPVQGAVSEVPGQSNVEGAAINQEER